MDQEDDIQQEDITDRTDNKEMEEAGIIPTSKDTYEEDPHTLQRQFCPFDVGSHRKPVSQIPVAPPGVERKYAWLAIKFS